MGAIPVTKPCKANSRAAAQANLIQPRYPKAGVASLSKRMKPAIEIEPTDSAVSDSPGWLGAAREDRGVEEPGIPAEYLCGSRTAHSSGEAGNDRGAKGLNGNMPLYEGERSALGLSLLRTSGTARDSLARDSGSIQNDRAIARLDSVFRERRMREIRTSGSIRGEARRSPTLPAFS